MASRAASPAAKPAFGHTATIALDQDGVALLELTLEPPGTAARPTAWLLLHTIPVSASLTTVLTRLLEAQATAAEQLASGDPVGGGSSESLAASDDIDCDNGGDGSGSGGGGTPVSGGRLSASRRSAAAAARPRPPRRSSSIASAAAGWIEFARVGYVVSEIHAYCLLLRCSSARRAAALKATLERGAALGTATPVEFVANRDVTLRQRSGAAADNEATVRRLPLAQAAMVGTGAGGGGATPALPPQSAPSDSPGRRAATSPGWPTPRLASASGGGSAFGMSALATPLAASSGAAPPSPYLLPLNPGSPPGTPATAAAAASPPPPPRYGGGGDEPCPICQVEPLGSHPCVLTLCHHAYHLGCYAKLASAECPLCRFSLYALLSDARCGWCGTNEDLWACLLCGCLACGRGRRNHQRLHYEGTGHSCAMQSTTNRLWSERGRMFLNQEVALLLGEFDDTHGTGTPAPLSPDALWLSRPEDVVPDKASGGLSAAAAAAAAEGAELLAALAESRDAAVQDYYAGTLHGLLEEQRQWYAAQQRALVAAVTAAAAATSSATTAATSAAPQAAASLVALVRAERAGRRAVAAAYADAARETVAAAATALRAAAKRHRGRQEALRERVLLQSHRSSGLQSAITRLQQRLAEAGGKAARDLAAKQARQLELEARVAEALARLT